MLHAFQRIGLSVDYWICGSTFSEQQLPFTSELLFAGLSGLGISGFSLADFIIASTGSPEMVYIPELGLHSLVTLLQLWGCLMTSAVLHPSWLTPSGASLRFLPRKGKFSIPAPPRLSLGLLCLELHRLLWHQHSPLCACSVSNPWICLFWF